MRTNNFTQNMLKKSNAALAEILEDKETYTDEAIQAVIWELENRDIIEKGSIIHNPVLLEKDILVEEKEIEDIPAASIEELAIPTLYSKRAIQGFTIFFSTLFGAVLLMNNLKKLKQTKGENGSICFWNWVYLFNDFAFELPSKNLFFNHGFQPNWLCCFGGVLLE
jgi:hypothetical protein